MDNKVKKITDASLGKLCSVFIVTSGDTSNIDMSSNEYPTTSLIFVPVKNSEVYKLFLSDEQGYLHPTNDSTTVINNVSENSSSSSIESRLTALENNNLLLSTIISNLTVGKTQADAGKVIINPNSGNNISSYVGNIINNGGATNIINESTGISGSTGSSYQPNNSYSYNTSYAYSYTYNDTSYTYNGTSYTYNTISNAKPTISSFVKNTKVANVDKIVQNSVINLTTDKNILTNEIVNSTSIENTAIYQDSPNSNLIKDISSNVLSGSFMYTLYQFTPENDDNRMYVCVGKWPSICSQYMWCDIQTETDGYIYINVWFGGHVKVFDSSVALKTITPPNAYWKKILWDGTYYVCFNDYDYEKYSTALYDLDGNYVELIPEINGSYDETVTDYASVAKLATPENLDEYYGNKTGIPIITKRFRTKHKVKAGVYKFIRSEDKNVYLTKQVSTLHI